MIEYRKQLEAVCNQLSAEIESAEICGESVGMFAFAQHLGRAVEIYCGEQGEVLVECWEKGCDASKRTDAYPSYDAATDAARIWLLG